MQREPGKREFIEQYVLNAALGAGHLKLNVIGAIKEAATAWDEIDQRFPRITPPEEK